MQSQAHLSFSAEGALERVTTGKTFARAERHRTLLRYLVDRALAGAADDVKEITIAAEVFHKDSYDPQIDSQVRVEIGKLRERLERYYAGEGSGDPVRIEIPKGCYLPVLREIAPVIETASPSAGRRRLAWMAAAVVVVAGVAATIQAPRRTPGNVSKPAIAVLPFQDLSPSKDQEYFCIGMTEELIGDLMRLQIFRVLPRSATSAFQGRTNSVREIGQRLGVQAVVDGSVRKEGNHVRISVQLIDTEQGLEIWSQTYNRDLGSILEIQSEIAESVVRSFHLDLPDVRRALVRQHTRSGEAYQHYLQAAHLFGSDPERALEFYRAAVRSDAGYALAWAGLAAAWNRIVDWYLAPASKAREEALAAAAKAVALNPRLPEAHHALGVARLYFERDWHGAERELLKAIELDPMHGEYSWEYARLMLIPTGRFSEAADLLHKAVALEPEKVALHNALANSYLKARQFTAAIPHLETSRRISPHATSAIVLQGIAASGLERHEEALQKFEEAAGGQRSVWVLGQLGYTLGKLGRVNDARQVIAELERKGNADFEIAAVNSGIGEREQALAGLARAKAAYSHPLLWIKVDYRLDGLRGEPRFRDLVKAVGLD